MRARTFVSVAVCVSRKLRPCPSYSGRRDRNNSVHWCSLYKGGGGTIVAVQMSGDLLLFWAPHNAMAITYAYNMM